MIDMLELLYPGERLQGAPKLLLRHPESELHRS
jgi:hypothetical protein